MGKLINRIRDWRLRISSLPGSALRARVESLGKTSRCQQAFSKHCLVNLISKYTHLANFLYTSVSLEIQQVFSKHCLVNLISKYTHLVFSIYRPLNNVHADVSSRPRDFISVSVFTYTHTLCLRGESEHIVAQQYDKCQTLLHWHINEPRHGAI